MLGVLTPGNAVLGVGDGVVATSTVTSDLNLRWAVWHRVSTDLDARWAVLALVESDVQALWQVGARISSDLNVRWIVRTPGEGRDVKFVVLLAAQGRWVARLEEQNA